MNFNKKIILILASVMSFAFYFLVSEKDSSTNNLNLFTDKVHADAAVVSNPPTGPSEGSGEGGDEGSCSCEGCGSSEGSGEGSQ